MEKISFYRIGLLFKRYFCENWKKDVIVVAIIFAIDMLTSIGQGESAISWPLLFVFFILYSGRIFGMLGKPQKAVSYLMLPASSGEKLAVNIVLSHFYYPVLLVAASCLGIWASSFFCYFIYDEFVFKSVNCVFTQKLWYVFLFLLVNNAIMMFGSVYFKKAAVIKTLLCEAAFFMVLAIAIIIVAFKMINLDSQVIADSIAHVDAIVSAFMLCVTVFFWVLSYFRLKETEA